MLGPEALITALDARGFQRDETKKLVRFGGDGVLMAVKRDVADRHATPLVVEPGAWDRLASPPLGTQGGKRFHSSNLKGFPRLRHTGEGLTNVGFDVGVADEAALDRLLLALRDRAPADPLSDIAAAEPGFVGLSGTEREALKRARIGQGRFRDGLFAAWAGRCAVSGVAVADLLRASHIKPWAASDDRERLDPSNGLLLVATLDAAFDAGLISFDDVGAMLLSPALGPAAHAMLGTAAGAGLSRRPSPIQATHLAYHRTYVFRGA